MTTKKVVKKVVKEAPKTTKIYLGLSNDEYGWNEWDVHYSRKDAETNCRYFVEIQVPVMSKQRFKGVQIGTWEIEEVAEAA